MRKFASTGARPIVCRVQQKSTDAERVLFVHAHPDDETLTTGGTIATLVDAGAMVTVVTCTRGELGEVMPGEVTEPEARAELRVAELASALAVLGVTDHRFLGSDGARRAGLSPRRYTDSGTGWGASGTEASPTASDDTLCAATFGEVAADIATVINAVKPDAVISYNAAGGDGHPDHVRVYEASRHAAEVMGVAYFAVETDGADGQIAVDIAAVLSRKRDALRAHRSQVTVDDDHYSLAGRPRQPIATVERFTRMGPTPEAVAWKDQGIGVHLFAWIITLALGAAIGGIATVNHQFSVTVVGFDLPLGIIVTLLIVAALLVGLRMVFDGRLMATIAAIGMLVVIGILSQASSGGSVLVPANLAGYLLTYGTAAITLVALAWPTPGTFTRDKIVHRPKPKGTPSP